MLSQTPAGLPWYPQCEYIHIDTLFSLLLLSLMLDAKATHTWLTHFNVSFHTLIEISFQVLYPKPSEASFLSHSPPLLHIIIPHDIRCQPTPGQGNSFSFQSHTPHCPLLMQVLNASEVVKWNTALADNVTKQGQVKYEN